MWSERGHLGHLCLDTFYKHCSLGWDGEQRKSPSGIDAIKVMPLEQSKSTNHMNNMLAAAAAAKALAKEQVRHGISQM